MEEKIASEAVRVLEPAHQRWAKKLAAYGIEWEDAYINTINNVIEAKVIVSRTLLDEVLQRVKDKEYPTYDQGLTGIFTTPYTFDPALRVKKLSVMAFEKKLTLLIDKMA